MGRSLEDIRKGYIQEMQEVTFIIEKLEGTLVQQGQRKEQLKGALHALELVIKESKQPTAPAPVSNTQAPTPPPAPSSNDSPAPQAPAADQNQSSAPAAAPTAPSSSDSGAATSNDSPAPAATPGA